MKQLKCGAAERIITPALGLEIPGYFGGRVATGVKDDLYTQAVVVDDGERVVAMVSIDIIDYRPKLTAQIRNKVKKLIDVDVDVMTAATHSHTASPSNYLIFDSKPDAKTIANVVAKSVEAIVEAYEKRVPVKAGYGRGEEDRVGFCRNYYLNDGTIKTNPGAKRADMVVGPVSEIDHSVNVLRFDTEDGKPVAMIVNHACHLDCVGGSEYCADYAGELRRVLKDTYGKEMVVAFFNGCAGDVNHIDGMRFKKDPDFVYPKGEHHLWMGRVLAADVIEINKSIKTDLEPVVAAVSRTFREKRRQPSEEEIAWAKEILKTPDAKKPDRVYADEITLMVEEPKYWETIEVQAIRIGDCAFVALPGEIFSDIGLAIKKDSPFKNSVMVELGNGTHGYICTEPCFSAGVYEAKIAVVNACLFPSAGDKMVSVAGELLEELAAL